MRIRVLLVACLMVWGACDESPSKRAPVDPGAYDTAGQAVLDGHGRQLLLRGVNVPTFDNTADDFARIAGWGGNFIRLLYFWAHVEPQEGSIDHDFIDRMAEQVELARQHGLLVLLDMHQHSFGVGFLWGMPLWACDQALYDACEQPCDYFDIEVQECFRRFWENPTLQQQYLDHLVLLAERFADDPTVIGFDVMNEPFCGHVGPQECGAVLGDFYERAAAEIHAVAPHKLIFFEPNYLAYIGLPSEVTPPQFERGVYAPHYYLMSVHDGADYDLDPGPILHDLAMRAGEAETYETPLMIGEFGGMASVAGFDQYMDDHMDAFDDHLAGYTYWLYARGDGFHLLDDSGEEKPFVDYFVRPYPQRTPGRLTALSYDHDTRVMNLSFAGDASLDATGLLYVPDRHYPDGFTLTGCDAPDCTWSPGPDSQQVAFWVTAAQDYSFTLSP